MNGLQLGDGIQNAARARAARFIPLRMFRLQHAHNPRFEWVIEFEQARVGAATTERAK